MKKLLILLLIPFLSLPSYGTHLAGGTIRVICIGGNQYQIQVIKYRDPGGNMMLAGDVVVVGTFTQTYPISLYSFNPQLPQPNTNPCWVPPLASYLEKFIFQTDPITLLPGSNYTIYHSQFNRNSTNTMPFQTAFLLYSYLPNHGGFGCNNSPVFKENPPMAVCLNEPLQYDASAIDPDGDSLEYRLCNALTGVSIHFDTAYYAPPYSGIYPLQSSPALSIDKNTGLVTGTPTLIGAYSGKWNLTYCVDEFRNGVKIGEYNREVQITVSDCNISVTPSIGSQYTSIGLGVDVVASCDDYTVEFKNTTYGGGSFFWDFGVPGIDIDTSSHFEPTYTYPDTGTYLVKLIVNKGLACADTITKTVIVYPGINAGFAHSQSLCEGEPVLFSDQSTMTYGLPIYWRWQFGDGDTSVLQHPTHTYDSSGSYYAQLMLESSKGCRDTVWEPIQVGLIGLGADTLICGTQHVLDIGNPPGNILWSTGAQTQQITVMSSGTYSVTVSDGICTKMDTIEVILEPVPMISLDPRVDLCFGDTTYPQISSTGATFHWTPSFGVICDTCLHTGLFPSQTTTYTLTAWSAAGCGVSDTVLVEVSTNTTPEITGIIQTSQGQPYQNGRVLLIEYNALDSTVTAIDSTWTDNLGSFTFFTSQPQVYVKAIPDSATYPNELPTYYETGLVWDSADVISSQPCDSTFLSFSTIGGVNPGGPGFIAGNIFQGAGKMLDRSDPIEGLILILLDEAGNPVDVTITDQEGHYRFGSLALGRYSIWADKPFMRNNAAPEVELTSIDPVIDSLWIKYYDRQLFLDVTSIPPATGAKAFSIYPNPGNSILFIESPYEAGTEWEITMVSTLGKEVSTRATTERITTLDVRQLPQGMYFVQVNYEGERRTYPVVVSR